MSTIVKSKLDNKKYFLIGTGFGTYKATRPSFFGGNLFPNEEEGSISTAAICDEYGNIHWINSDDIKVISIDGQPLEDIKNQLK